MSTIRGVAGSPSHPLSPVESVDKCDSVAMCRSWGKGQPKSQAHQHHALLFPSFIVKCEWHTIRGYNMQSTWTWTIQTCVPRLRASVRACIRLSEDEAKRSQACTFSSRYASIQLFDSRNALHLFCMGGASTKGASIPTNIQGRYLSIQLFGA